MAPMTNVLTCDDRGTDKAVRQVSPHPPLPKAFILNPSTGKDPGPMVPRERRARDRSGGDTSVYLYYDKYNTLIYVGLTERGMWRNRQHDEYAEWWPFVARQEIEHHGSRVGAFKREKSLIVQYRPPFNRRSNPEHEALKAAYLKWQAGECEANPTELARALDKRLPLTVVEIGMDDRFVLKGHAEHSAITQRIITPAKLPVRVGWPGQPRIKVGHLAECHLQGAFAFFLVRRHPKLAQIHLADTAYAQLKFASQKPLTFQILNIEVDRFEAQDVRRTRETGVVG